MKSIARLAVIPVTCAIAVGLAAACSSSKNGGSSTTGHPGADASGGGDAGLVVTLDGPTSGAPEPGTIVGQLSTPPSTALPSLPALTNVFGLEREDSVGIDFDPVDGAVDYRVYPLPNDSDVTANADRSVTIKNAVYRCAGIRQTFDMPNNIGNDVQHPDAGQVYAFGQYAWTAKVPTTPTVGYVYVSSASDRQPVYAVGVHPASNESGWRESRPKIYTTSATTRQTLISQGGRDDGIVFYVPAASGSSTTTIYHSEKATPIQGANWTQYGEYYFTSADMASHASDTTPPAAAFSVLTASAADTQPLMAVLYTADQPHTELSVGSERYKRATHQGPGPLWHLEWSGITQTTTLVVEALASGCPFQGLLSPQALKAPPHQTLFTLDQLQQASSTGEVFINGQYSLPGTTDAGALLQTTTASPVVLARSFVQVSPQPHDPTVWDFYEGFSGSGALGTETATPDKPSCNCSASGTPPCENGNGFCGYWTSPILNYGFYESDDPGHVAVFTHGQFLGQLWHVFDDWAQDVTGTVRFTAPTMASISTDSKKFLHVTWSVNAVSTDRRYPQLIVSDQPSPVQDGFSNTNGNVVLVQTIQGPSIRFEVEAFHGLVNGHPWAVNNQSPFHALVDYDAWDQMSHSTPMPPAEPVFEHIGVDRMTKFDAYISSGLLFTFVDGTPAGCAQLPTGNGFTLGGSVTVTFGDVLYHEGAPDELVCAQSKPYAFLHTHECMETKRHWDDLGFKSGVDAPAWDLTNFPCTPF
jgi:hypothetical protein